MRLQGLEIVNLQVLARQSKIGYARLYHQKTGFVKKPLTLKEATRVMNGLKELLSPVATQLGFEITIRKK